MRKPEENPAAGKLIEDLRNRLAEAEETLDAIRHGEVDALVVNTPQGDQIFTLKSAERPYRIMVEQMTEGALTLSMDGAVIFCNQRFAQMLKTPLEKLMASPIYGYIAAEDRERFLALVQQSGRNEIAFLAEDNTQVPTYVSVSALNLDEETLVHARVITDLTEHNITEEELKKYRQHLEELVQQRTNDLEKANLELKKEMAERLKAEESLQKYTGELEAANNELEAFSYSVSHDLRAPLRNLDGFAHVIEEDYADKLDATGRDYLNRIIKSSRHMSELIDDMLKLSRISRAEMYRDQVDLGRSPGLSWRNSRNLNRNARRSLTFSLV